MDVQHLQHLSREKRLGGDGDLHGTSHTVPDAGFRKRREQEGPSGAHANLALPRKNELLSLFQMEATRPRSIKHHHSPSPRRTGRLAKLVPKGDVERKICGESSNSDVSCPVKFPRNACRPIQGFHHVPNASSTKPSKPSVMVLQLFLLGNTTREQSCKVVHDLAQHPCQLRVADRIYVLKPFWNRTAGGLSPFLGNGQHRSGSRSFSLGRGYDPTSAAHHR